MRRLEYRAGVSDVSRTVESVLLREFSMSRTAVSRLKRQTDGILRNGEKTYTTARLQAGDLVSAAIADVRPSAAAPMPAPLCIRFEDEYLLVLDKAAGMAVHPTHDPAEITVENALAAYFSPDETAHPVNRLDRGTTGLMLIAKSGYVHARLFSQMQTGGFEKRYLGVARGRVAPPEGEICLPIGFAPGSSYKRAIDPAGRPARSAYRSLCAAGGYTLVELIPHTGRTHQLRVHMAALGFPLAGDWLYGQEGADPIGRPALHACLLAFTHPLTGERLCFSAPLPADMAALISQT